METKSWWTSRTIWGGIITVIAFLVQLFGWTTITPEEQATLIDKLPMIATIIGEVVGFILVIMGRIKAEKAIG